MNESPSQPTDTPSCSRNAAGVAVLGLTGALAAGKTTAARAFEARGCHVIDVDALGHAALEEPQVRRAVVEAFGAGVAAPDGALDRARLAELAFRCAESLARLEALVHPAVRRAVATELDAARRGSARAVVIDCALLFEGGLDALCDVTICVQADEATRRARARATRGTEADDVARREAAQLSAAEKGARAAYILPNEDTPEGLADEVAILLERLAPLPTGRGGGTDATNRCAGAHHAQGAEDGGQD